MRAGYISREIAYQFGRVPDNHADPNWYKVVVMDHVTLEKLTPLVEYFRKTLRCFFLSNVGVYSLNRYHRQLLSTSSVPMAKEANFSHLLSLALMDLNLPRMKIFDMGLALLVLGLHSAHAINPDRAYLMTPDAVNWPYEQLTIRTTDQFELNTWIYAANPENDRNTVLVLAYPDAGNMSYWVYYAWKMAQSGFTVVTFDYRGFGKSADFEIRRDYLYYTEFSYDLQAVVRNISTRYPDKALGIWCLSMGTIVTCRAFPEIRDQVDFVIGEGFVADTARIISRYTAMDKKLVLPESSTDYLSAIHALDVSVLIFSASADPITTTQDAHELQEKWGANRCTVIEYEGDHLRGFQMAFDQYGFGGWYLTQVNAFLEQ